jgi:hypothetical protein
VTLCSFSLLSLSVVDDEFLWVLLAIFTYEANKLRFVNDGHNAKRIEIGRMRKTTGIIIEISALPAAARIRLR